MTRLSHEPQRTLCMEIDRIRSNGLMQGHDAVNATVEEWSGQLKHHIRQQATQIGANKIDAPHDIISVHADRDEWSVKAVLLDDWEMSELFVADTYRYRVNEEDGSKATVTYEADNTQQRDEILDRVENAAVEAVVEMTEWEADMLDLHFVKLGEHSDTVKLHS